MVDSVFAIIIVISQWKNLLLQFRRINFIDTVIKSLRPVVHIYASMDCIIRFNASGISMKFESNTFFSMYQFDPSHKSHNASDKYPTMQHFVTEMCTHVHISVTKCCIGGCGTDAFWDLWDGSIEYVCKMASILCNGQTMLICDTNNRAWYIFFSYLSNFDFGNQIFFKSNDIRFKTIISQNQVHLHG